MLKPSCISSAIYDSITYARDSLSALFLSVFYSSTEGPAKQTNINSILRGNYHSENRFIYIPQYIILSTNVLILFHSHKFLSSEVGDMLYEATSNIRCTLEFNINFICILYFNWKTGIAQSVQRLATAWTAQGSNPGGGEIFCTPPDRPWVPPSLLYNGYRLFPGVKRPGRGVDHQTHSSAEVGVRV